MSRLFKGSAGICPATFGLVFKALNDMVLEKSLDIPESLAASLTGRTANGQKVIVKLVNC